MAPPRRSMLRVLHSLQLHRVNTRQLKWEYANWLSTTSVFRNRVLFFTLRFTLLLSPHRLSMRQSEKCPVTWHHSVCFHSPSSGHSWSAMTPFTWFAALNAACLLHCGAVLSSEAEDGGSPAWCLRLRLPLKQQKWPLSGPQWEQIARK